jgi:hypothetical protein
MLGLKGNFYCYSDVIEIYPFQLMLLANINVDQGWVNGKLALVHRALERPRCDQSCRP